MEPENTVDGQHPVVLLAAGVFSGVAVAAAWYTGLFATPASFVLFPLGGLSAWTFCSGLGPLLFSRDAAGDGVERHQDDATMPLETGLPDPVLAPAPPSHEQGAFTVRLFNERNRSFTTVGQGGWDRSA